MDEKPKSAVVIDTIDLDDPYQVSQWTEIWDISVAELIEAVQACGTDARQVKRYLRARRG
jgi:uncharacterized protein DUF3606